MKKFVAQLVLLGSLSLFAESPGLRVEGVRPGAIFSPEENLVFRVEGPTGSALTAILSDYKGKVLAKLEKKSGRPERRFDFGKKAVGYYELRVEASPELWETRSVAILPGRPAEPQKNVFGIIAHLKKVSAEEMTNRLSLLSRLGVNWVREGFLWNLIEPKPGAYQWELFDRIVSESQRVGIRVLPVAAYGVDWASTGPESLKPDDLRMFVPRPEPWTRYLGALVERYGKSVDHWEIWNEPNGKNFWKPEPTNSEGYADLLALSYQAVKKIQPKAFVITAGLSPKNWRKETPGDHEERFVEAFCRKVPAPFDLVGYHPYTAPRGEHSNAVMVGKIPKMTAPVVEAMKSTMKNAGQGEKKIWFTELGTPTHRYMSEARTAEYLPMIFTKCLSMSNVGGQFWYDLVDDGTNALDPEHHFGLLHLDGTPKPALISYHTLIRKLGNADFVREEGDSSVSVYHFDRAGKTVLVMFANGTNGASRRLEKTGTKVRVTDHMGLEEIRDASAEGFQLNLGSGPVYVEY